jgi:hypothetical protein
VRGSLRTEETAERRALHVWLSNMSSWESLKRPSWRVKCLPMRRPRMTRILRDCVSREVERALMRDVVVHFSSFQCLMKDDVCASHLPY